MTKAMHKSTNPNIFEVYIKLLKNTILYLEISCHGMLSLRSGQVMHFPCLVFIATHSIILDLNYEINTIVDNCVLCEEI